MVVLLSLSVLVVVEKRSPRYSSSSVGSSFIDDCIGIVYVVYVVYVWCSKEEGMTGGGGTSLLTQGGRNDRRRVEGKEEGMTGGG